jgi:hypothetical protein
MPNGDLRQLAAVEEISIGCTRPDRSTGSTPVRVGQAGDAVFVRSIPGRRSPDPGAHQAGHRRPDQGPAAATPPRPNGSSQNQDEQPQGDPWEAPGFGDRISRRRETVRASVRLAFRAHICGLVPASDVYWLADSSRFVPCPLIPSPAPWDI